MLSTYKLLYIIECILTQDPSPIMDLMRFALTPIRDIEKVTGINFFSNLTIEGQNTLELRLTNELWTQNTRTLVP